MTKPVLLIHNGNSSVKNIVAEMLQMEKVNSIAVFDTLNDMINFLSSCHNSVTDITCADNFSHQDIWRLKPYCKIIKVLTSFENDLGNLEDVWQNYYNKTQWKIATAKHLWAVDEILFMDHISEPLPEQSNKDVVFTANRTGTNILASAVGIDKIWGEFKLLHNCRDQVVFEDGIFDQVLASKTVYSTMRESLFDYLASCEIADYLECNYVNTVFTEKRDVIVNEHEMSHDFIDKQFEEICNFVDLLLLAKIVYNKDVKLTTMERMHSYFPKVKHAKKNKYDKTSIITNHKEIISYLSENGFSEWHKHILKHLGTTIGYFRVV